jgi:hypothetical protein
VKQQNKRSQKQPDTRQSGHSRCPFILLLCLGAISTLSAGAQDAGQSQDTQRKIVSDDFIKSRPERSGSGKTRVPPKRHNYRLVSNASAKVSPSRAGSFMKLGITIWKMSPARSLDSDRRALIRERGQQVVWGGARAESDGSFREGDHVRFSVESPGSGYLYVVDRDLLTDGKTGEPMLIFPWSDADNRLVPGSLIDIPGADDVPNSFTARLTSQNQVGELLTFIVTTTPLKLPLSDKPLPIALKDLNEWEKSWGGATERYEMEGGAGQFWTREEQQAAAKNRRRQLTRDDPTPQTIYRVFVSNNRGMVANLVLRYRSE